MATPNSCHAEACAIQNCIQRNRYDESKCTKLIDELYSCCSRIYRDNGTDLKPIACPRPELLQLKIEQRKREKVDATLIK